MPRNKSAGQDGDAILERYRVRQVVDSSTQPIRAFVLDANGMSDIDYTGTRTLCELTTELAQRGVATGIARSSHLVHHDLKHGGLVKEIGPDHLITTVEAAVDALARET